MTLRGSVQSLDGPRARPQGRVGRSTGGPSSQIPGPRPWWRGNCGRVPDGPGTSDLGRKATEKLSSSLMSLHLPYPVYRAYSDLRTTKWPVPFPVPGCTSALRGLPLCGAERQRADVCRGVLDGVTTCLLIVSTVRTHLLKAAPSQSKVICFGR